MKRPKLNEKYYKICKYAVISVCLVLLFAFALQNLDIVSGKLSDILTFVYDMLKPVLIGFCIAYFLYKPTNYLSQKLESTKSLNSRPKLARLFAVLIVMAIALALFIQLFYFIIPNTIESITQIAGSLQSHMGQAQSVLTDLAKHPLIENILQLFRIDLSTPAKINQFLMQFTTQAQTWLEGVGAYLLNLAVQTGSLVYNILPGFFFSIYMLLEKHNLTSQLQRFLKVIMSKNYERLCTVAGLMDFMFFKFLSGKGICSIIVGILCYIGCTIFHIQYAALISLIVTVTNMIPLFGPYVGAVPAVLLSLLTSNISGLIMLIIIIVIQQIDCNILAPNILGDVVGLNGFWIMFSIIFCGKLFGVWGMFLAVPIFAVLRIITAEWLYDKERKPKDTLSE